MFKFHEQVIYNRNKCLAEISVESFESVDKMGFYDKWWKVYQRLATAPSKIANFMKVS